MKSVSRLARKLCMRMLIWLGNLGQIKAEVMAYEHPELVRRLIKKLGISEEVAQRAFVELKQYLFICGTKRGLMSFAPQSGLVDEAWHNFMLYSRDYHRFCFRHFGRLIHHQPFSEIESLANDGQGMRNTLKALAMAFNNSSAQDRDFGHKHGLPAMASSMSNCIDVPPGDCSGSTNCQSDCKDN